MTDDIPNDWIPLHRGGEGPIYIQVRGGGLRLIRHREEKPNDVINLYKSEVVELLHKFIDYLDGSLK